jgi:hypothetical protein
MGGTGNTPCTHGANLPGSFGDEGIYPHPEAGANPSLRRWEGHVSAELAISRKALYINYLSIDKSRLPQLESMG